MLEREEEVAERGKMQDVLFLAGAHDHVIVEAGEGRPPAMSGLNRRVLTGRFTGTVKPQFGVRRTACVSTFPPTVTWANPAIWPWELTALADCRLIPATVISLLRSVITPFVQTKALCPPETDAVPTTTVTPLTLLTPHAWEAPPFTRTPRSVGGAVGSRHSVACI